MGGAGVPPNMRTFYSDPERSLADRIRLDPAEAHHARAVLRLPAGETVRVLDGRGAVFQGAWDPETGCVQVAKRLRSPPFQCDVTLAVALLKGDRWGWLIEKAVEIGVSSIVPLLTGHCVVRLHPSQFQTRQARWKQMAISALKQSGQPFLPSIEVPMTVEDFCGKAAPGARWILSERGGTPLRSLLAPDLTRVTLLVGPEGGWSEEEMDTARRQFFQPVTLGPQVLRAETAPLYALSAIWFVTGKT